jgi:hypothetical protein
MRGAALAALSPTARWNHKQQVSRYGLKRRRRFQALGLCTRCGAEKERFDRKSCNACLELMRIKEEARARPGFCTHCRKVPVEGRTLCEGCRAGVNSRVYGWMTRASKIVKAAEALVLATEYINNDLSVEEMDRARAQAAKSMRLLFHAVHALQQRRASFKKPPQQESTSRRAA